MINDYLDIISIVKLKVLFTHTLFINAYRWAYQLRSGMGE
jgi:hypothetical protein